jgi:hypothetical protein
MAYTYEQFWTKRLLSPQKCKSRPARARVVSVYFRNREDFGLNNDNQMVPGDTAVGRRTCSGEHQPGLCSTAFAQLDKQWTVPLASWLPKLFSSSGSGSALYGALVGGLFVLLAQLLANWAQRERDRQSERQALTGTQRAIQAQVLGLRADFLMPLCDRLKAVEPGPFPQVLASAFFMTFVMILDLSRCFIRRK